jgi:hypothetical protein
MFLRFRKPAVNPLRGEVAACIDSQWRILRLDLDALARLESRVPDASLLQFVERVATQGLQVTDVGHVLSVVLSDQMVAQGQGADVEGLHITGGYLAAHKLAVELLHAAFAMSPAQASSVQGEKDETTQ